MGSPVTGSRAISVTLWKSATGSAAADRACLTVPGSNTDVAAGFFAIDLDPSCTAAVNANPDLWVEITVAGQALPRTKLKAVPYALEAGRVPWSGISGVPAVWPGTVPWSSVTNAPVNVAPYHTLSASVAGTTGGVSAPGVITRQDGAWLASVNYEQGFAQWVLQFAPGTFSATPTCVTFGSNAINNLTATGVSLGTGNQNGAPFHIICTGPR
jgi:hypothetical protein